MRKINPLRRVMMAIFATILMPAFLFAGNVQINNGKTELTIKENTYARLVVSSTVAGFSFTDVTTPRGSFAMLSMEGYGNRNMEGTPALPVFHKLIEVPVNATFSVRILRQHYQEISLPEAGILNPVFPAQLPMSKGDDPLKVPFLYDKEIYQTNAFIADNLASVSFVGTLRALNLARVDLCPVQYNPVEKKLRIYDILEVEITFEGANVPATLDLKSRNASPYFNSFYRLVSNYKPLPFTDELITASPVTYVIVSDPMFQTTLQPFIAWKKKKGFKVIEGYTNNPAVGTTTTSIKAYLQGLYTTPPAGYNVPSFVLFVGDVAQIPAWAGGAGSHYTDLRYCEYTNDNLPEVYYGRFSATSVAQLQPQIDKTLEYEQYTMPDPSFLGEAVMAAGADASFQTHSNGQIYYGTENYFNAAHGILSHTYLQPEPSGGNYAQNIHANVSAGVAFANYTAHCSENGWASPSFVISDIANLTNNHKYSLMVGNCCLSCKFDVTCFAEEMLRAANKGTVGYIGGSNNTYWDEDYWWGCGFKSVVLHPAFDANHIGAYDGAFHDHGEPIADWFVTQGQMVVCGNYAVEESNTSRKQYYWEIYHLMGDPSLMTYYSVPTAITASYQNPLMIGMTSLAVNTVPYGYIALSMNGVLLDARIADATGAATLNFTALSAPGAADIVITKQNKQPYISTIQVIPAAGPFVVYTNSTISDPLPNGNNNAQMDFGETNALNVSLKNVGVETAPNVVATLSTSSSWITLTDNTEPFGNIGPSQTITQANAFTYNVANNIPDQQVIPFTIQAVSGANTWNSSFNLTANAPLLQVGDMTVQDNGPGCDNDGILDPGETANLLIITNNNGHAGITGVIGSLSIVGGSSTYLVINNGASAIGAIAAAGSGTAVFSVTANASTPIGTGVDLNFTVTGGTAGQYSANASKQVVIGLIPTFIMSSATITTCTGNFYDPGGPSAPYGDSQDFTMVVNPGTPGSMLRVVFSSFVLESNTSCSFDYLNIYNGNSTSAPLLGTWCGTSSPGTIVANNATGSLTFVFHSDGSVTPDGWVAGFSCLSGVVVNPSAFSAAAVSTSQINLGWTSNASGNNVMLVFSTNNVFGVPVNGTTYSAGNAIPEGGTVIFRGPGNAYSHTGLNASTTYYYKAYSYDGSNTYSIGVSAQANTACSTIATYPWNEGFENGGVMPSCWTQEQVGASGINWTFIAGNGGSYPSTAHTGSYNACLKDASSADNKTMLISPMLNLAGLPNPQVKFWHTQAYWSGDQDLLTVYYRNTPGGTWTLLTTYTGSITAWTQETISLPNATGTYYIAFEGNAKFGYGVCIDDVQVSSSCATVYPVSISITASANPVTSGTSVTFMAAPVNGGTTPAYQWKVNAVNANNATDATYTYVPSNGDVVTCTLTSNLSCAGGSPATSNQVVMTVTSAVPSTYTVQNVTLGSGQTGCYNAITTLTVAGIGSSFTVQNGGVATMIAGLKILFEPGTVVLPGGFLHGYITTTNDFCNQTDQSGGMIAAGTPVITGKDVPGNVRIYPNPTSGIFRIELSGFERNQAAAVEIYNMTGNRLQQMVVSCEQLHECSLAGYPAGIYLVRICAGDVSESIRVIKQ